MDRNTALFQAGVGLALVSALAMVIGDAPISLPITLLIVGIILIAASRRNRSAC